MKTSLFYRGVCSLCFLLLPSLFACKKNDGLNPVQILVNTDVETGTLAPNSWGADPGTSGVYSLEWTKDIAFSSTHSLKISAQNSTSPGFSYWYQAFQGEMPNGKDLILSAKIKGDNLTGQGVSIAIRGDNSIPATSNGSQFMTTQGATSIQGTFDWTTYSVKLTNLSSDTKRLYVFLVYLPNTTGTVYFDDITLTHN